MQPGKVSARAINWVCQIGPLLAGAAVWIANDDGFIKALDDEGPRPAAATAANKRSNENLFCSGIHAVNVIAAFGAHYSAVSRALGTMNRPASQKVPHFSPYFGKLPCNGLSGVRI